MTHATNWLSLCVGCGVGAAGAPYVLPLAAHLSIPGGVTLPVLFAGLPAAYALGRAARRTGIRRRCETLAATLRDAARRLDAPIEATEPEAKIEQAAAPASGALAPAAPPLPSFFNLPPLEGPAAPVDGSVPAKAPAKPEAEPAKPLPPSPAAPAPKRTPPAEAPGVGTAEDAAPPAAVPPSETPVVFRAPVAQLEERALTPPAAPAEAATSEGLTTRLRRATPTPVPAKAPAPIPIADAADDEAPVVFSAPVRRFDEATAVKSPANPPAAPVPAIAAPRLTAPLPPVLTAVTTLSTPARTNAPAPTPATASTTPEPVAAAPSARAPSPVEEALPPAAEPAAKRPVGKGNEPVLVPQTLPVLRLPQRRPLRLWFEAGLALPSGAVVPAEALAGAGLPAAHLARLDVARLRAALRLRQGLGHDHPASAVLVPAGAATLADPELRDELAAHCTATAGMTAALAPVLPQNDLIALRARPAWTRLPGIEPALRLDGTYLPAVDLLVRAGVATLVVGADLLRDEARHDRGPLRALLEAFANAGGGVLAANVDDENTLREVLDLAVDQGFGACLASRQSERFLAAPLAA
ncbi:MAG: hypothetical protein KDG89_05795 [Geminicoccaceae bacterium]|nr:hypothetical protein [Geminicoccaceae bacterium]